MHGPINVKSPNNISEWQMGFNSAFKGLANVVYRKFCNIIEGYVKFKIRPDYREFNGRLPSFCSAQIGEVCL